MKLLLVVLVIGLCTVGCLVSTEQPVVQPVLEVPTYNGVTQYDYKAGAPNDYSVSETNNDTATVNPYLIPEPSYSWEYYFPQKPNIHYTPWAGGSRGYYYAFSIPPEVPVPPPVSVVFWSGSAVVTVGP